MTSGILFVSPYRKDAERLSRMLEPLNLVFDSVETVRQARAKLADASYEVVLTEAQLTDGEWLDVLEMAQEMRPRARVIVTDPLADGRFWAEALNLGAYDLVAQPFYESEVRRILA